MNKPPVTASENIPITPAPAGMHPPRRVSILLADDDLSTRNLNAEVLTRSGYQVATASDGVEAWQALNEDRYDLLITDHQMPWVTGLELIQKLRAEAKTLPVILVSGLLPEEEIKRHPELRIEATLQKPCQLEVLLDTVRLVLWGSGAGWGKDPMESP